MFAARRENPHRRDTSEAETGRRARYVVNSVGEEMAITDRPPARVARFKGTTLQHLAPWVRSRFSERAIDEAFRSLPSGLTATLDPTRADFGALPSAWYDARVYMHVFDTLLAGVPEREHRELAKAAAKAILDRTLRGIYKKLFGLMATPSLYARYAQKMWDTHYDTGRVEIVHLSPKVAHHRVIGWTGHHPFVCAMNRQSGAIVYEMMGVGDVTIRDERCAYPPKCEAVYDWELGFP